MSLNYLDPDLGIAIVDDPQTVAVCVTCEHDWTTADMKFHGHEIEEHKAAGHRVDDYRE